LIAHFLFLIIVILAYRNCLENNLKWLQSNSARGGKLYKEQFEKRWTSVTYPTSQIHLEAHDMAKKVDLSIRVIENISAGATSKLFEKQIREAVSSNFLW
jgi:hypothetical protein